MMKTISIPDSPQRKRRNIAIQTSSRGSTQDGSSFEDFHAKSKMRNQPKPKHPMQSSHGLNPIGVTVGHECRSVWLRWFTFGIRSVHLDAPPTSRLVSHRTVRTSNHQRFRQPRTEPWPPLRPKDRATGPTVKTMDPLPRLTTSNYQESLLTCSFRSLS